MPRSPWFAMLAASLVAGCVDGAPAPSVAVAQRAAVATGAPAVPAAFAQAGVTAIEPGSDGRPLIARFAGLRDEAAVATVAPLYGVRADDLVLIASEVDAGGVRHDRYQQHHDGLPVYGATLSVHVGRDGAVLATVATLRPVGPDAPVAIDATGAEARAAAAYPQLAARTVAADGLAYVVDPDGVARRCQVVWVRGQGPRQPVVDEVFVDAATGAIVAVHPRIHTAQSRRTYTAGGGTTLPGTLRLSEAQTTSGDSTLDTLHANVAKAYRCAMTQFGRDSFDGVGATVMATGHYDQGLINAFWDGSQLAFGDGDGVQSAPLVASDVVAHEFAHAVTERTSGLVYERQSSALNEAMSDIYAAMCTIREVGAVTPQAWLMGEDIWTPGTPGDALRYMANPTLDQYSQDHTSGMQPCTTPSEQNDYCYVHGNSGLPNLMFALLVSGGPHPRAGTAGIPATVQVPALGIDRAQAITYRAWTTYFEQNTDFVGARAAFAQAAAELYPGEPGTQAAVALAWYAVGVGAPVANLPSGTGDPNATQPGDPNDPNDPSDPSDPNDPNDPSTPDRPAEITGGCSAGGSAGLVPALAMLGVVALRRRRAARA